MLRSPCTENIHVVLINIWNSAFWKHVKHCIICTVVFLKRLIVPWWIHVWGNNDLKDTVLVSLCVPVMLLWTQINFASWSQVIMAVCRKEVFPFSCGTFYSPISKQIFCSFWWKGGLVRSYITHGLWKSANGSSGPWHHPPPLHSPTAVDGDTTAPAPGGGEGRKQLEQLLFWRGAQVCQEWGRASQTWPNAAASHGHPRQYVPWWGPLTHHTAVGDQLQQAGAGLAEWCSQPEESRSQL